MVGRKVGWGKLVWDMTQASLTSFVCVCLCVDQSLSYFVQLVCQLLAIIHIKSLTNIEHAFCFALSIVLHKCFNRNFQTRMH